MAAPRTRISDRTLLAHCLSRLFDIPHEHQKLMHEDQMIALVERDHFPIPFAEGGSNHFSNVWARLIAEHRDKTTKNNGTGRGDLTAIAHTKRLVRSQQEHGERMMAKLYGGPLPEPTRRKRKIAGRGFDKTKTRGFSGKVRERRSRP